MNKKPESTRKKNKADKMAMWNILKEIIEKTAKMAKNPKVTREQKKLLAANLRKIRKAI